MQGVNKVTLIGHLGSEPESRSLESGKTRVSFSLATNESYKNKMGEKVTNTEWHNIVLWYPLSDIAEKYLKKGSLIYLEGKLTNRSYEDKEGITRYRTEVIGRELTMLDSRSQSAEMDSRPQSKEYQNASSTDDASSDIDELPF